MIQEASFYIGCVQSSLIRRRSRRFLQALDSLCSVNTGVSSELTAGSTRQAVREFQSSLTPLTNELTARGYVFSPRSRGETPFPPLVLTEHLALPSRPITAGRGIAPNPNAELIVTALRLNTTSSLAGYCHPAHRLRRRRELRPPF